MATTKPDLTRVWANGAPPSNVVDPDTTTPGKFNAGWQAEVPPFEHFNFLQKWLTQGLAHANEQGIMVWDVNTTYPKYGLAKGSDGIIYEAITEQAANDPVADDTNWHMFGFAKTFAQLRLIEPKADKDSVYLIGHTIADKGGDAFVHSSSDVSTDNNGTKAEAPNSKIWSRKLNGYHSPEMYGAIGDGIVNDQIPLQSAINNFPVVICESGEYLFTKLTISGNQRTFTKRRQGWFTSDGTALDVCF
jgi:hypothetical protein